MDKHAIMEKAFREELGKIAGFADVMFSVGKALGKAKSVAAPMLARAGEAYAGSSVGKYMAQSPRLTKAVGFARDMAAGGAAFTLAQKAMAPSKKEVHILPADAQPGTMSQFQNTPLQRYGV